MKKRVYLGNNGPNALEKGKRFQTPIAIFITLYIRLIILEVRFLQRHNFDGALETCAYQSSIAGVVATITILDQDLH